MFVYLDNSATTKQYDQVTERMIRMAREDFGNPSSLHRMGMAAERAVKEARDDVARSLGAEADEIYFTGSGTEADNAAIFSAYRARKRRGNKIITSKAEHPAVLEACKRLSEAGAQVVYVNIDKKGLIDMEELKSSMDGSVILVTIMAVNNELGTVAPLEQIGDLVKSKEDALLHTDAIQAYGRIPISIDKWKADLIAVSSHKIHGPKGIGALYIRKGLTLPPYIFGGGQEKGLRSGTENTPGIAGFGTAARTMHENLRERMLIMGKVRDYLLSGIKAEIPDIVINSPEAVFGEEKTNQKAQKTNLPVSSPGILNVSFPGCRGEVLLHCLEQRDIYVSTGAACSSKKKGNRVLAAAGLAESLIESAVRFSFSEFNTVEQMDYVLTELKNAVLSMRKLSGVRSGESKHLHRQMR